jgi:hypothetical protein
MIRGLRRIASRIALIPAGETPSFYLPRCEASPSLSPAAEEAASSSGVTIARPERPLA